jgi:MoaA/NifB/PqqE/SkfB family radical SAM enzyme
MLAYAAPRARVTLLTNAMLLNGPRLEQLAAVNHPNLVVQVSLDGASPAEHEAYRGAGTWQKTVDGLRRLLARGFHARVSTTETPANCAGLNALRAFCAELGIPPEDHFIRPLAKAGFSEEGIEVGRESLLPELTVDVDGVYWHPLTTEANMRVSERIFPLAGAVRAARALQAEQASAGEAPAQKAFT